MKISKELIKGSSPILVLSVLENEDLYGYKIVKEIEKLSENVFTMNEGTLYPILHSLEAEEYLLAYWEEYEGRKRKYYHITTKGKMLLKSKKEEWKTYSVAVNKVLNFA
ncbi:MAG: PadR family transcriptional regulator [Eubacterium sp.]